MALGSGVMKGCFEVGVIVCAYCKVIFILINLAIFKEINLIELIGQTVSTPFWEYLVSFVFKLIYVTNDCEMRWIDENP